MGRRTPDLTGQTFGRLTARVRAPSRNGHVYWTCECTCGNTAEAQATMLLDGRHKSCGCLRTELTIARSTKHGEKPRAGGSRTWNSWMNMVRRCTKPNHPRYADWGGRGIQVCERWLDYRNFLADMGERPPGTTLNRIDNDGNYEPGNCEWATPAQQGRNNRGVKLTPALVQKIVLLSEDGLTMTEIARQLSINRHTVSKALFSKQP